MKYSDYFFYVFFCIFLFLANLRTVEYMYHKNIIEKKDKEKEKTFKYIRSKIVEGEEKKFFLTLEEKKDSSSPAQLSLSLQQKLALLKTFNVKNNSVEIKNQREHTRKDDLITEAAVAFFTQKHDQLRYYFEIYFQGKQRNSIMFSFFVFLVSSFLKKGIVFNDAVDLSKEILSLSNFMYFFSQTDQFDLVNFLLFLREKFVSSEDDHALFNRKAKRILKKIIIWNTKEKIEHERALNQFYNIAHRDESCAIFSFYPSEKKRVSSLEVYGDLHLDYDVYRSILFGYSKKPSVIRRRSLLEMPLSTKEKGFFMMPILHNNLVKYFSPLDDRAPLEKIFLSLGESQTVTLCSIICLDEEDMRFLLY